MNKTKNLTPEEAIEILKGEGDSINTLKRVQANSMGAEAIERCMIAKKPTHEASLLKCCTCPKCKNVIDKFEKFGDTTVRVRYNYCHFCGQKMDWSDVE